jgi:hypothetical protein
MSEEKTPSVRALARKFDDNESMVSVDSQIKELKEQTRKKRAAAREAESASAMSAVSGQWEDAESAAAVEIEAPEVSKAEDLPPPTKKEDAKSSNEQWEEIKPTKRRSHPETEPLEAARVRIPPPPATDTPRRQDNKDPRLCGLDMTPSWLAVTGIVTIGVVVIVLTAGHAAPIAAAKMSLLKAPGVGNAAGAAGALAVVQ